MLGSGIWSSAKIAAFAGNEYWDVGCCSCAIARQAEFTRWTSFCMPQAVVIYRGKKPDFGRGQVDCRYDKNMR